MKKKKELEVIDVLDRMGLIKTENCECDKKEKPDGNFRVGKYEGAYQRCLLCGKRIWYSWKKMRRLIKEYEERMKERKLTSRRKAERMGLLPVKICRCKKGSTGDVEFVSETKTYVNAEVRCKKCLGQKDAFSFSARAYKHVDGRLRTSPLPLWKYIKNLNQPQKKA